MKILPDGNVEITNKRTGEVKVVRPEELPNYNLQLPANYNSLLEQQKQQSLAVPSLSATPSLKVTDNLSKAQQMKTSMNQPVSDYETRYKDIQSKYNAAMQGKTPDEISLLQKSMEAELKTVEPTATEKAAQTQAAAAIKTPQQVNEVKDTIKNIDSILGRDLSFIGTPLAIISGSSKSTLLGNKARTNFGTAKQIQQVKDQLSLASVGKLKGQGQVSDAERMMLANAATALDVNMTLEDFKNELNKVKGILGRNLEPEAQQGMPPVSQMVQQPSVSAQNKPSKEAELLRRQAELSKYILPEEEYNKPENPITKAAAAVQQYLGNTKALPAVYGAIGRTVSGGNPLGTGVGAAYGERMRQSLSPGAKEEKLELGKIVLTGVEAAAIDKIFSMGGKYIREAIQAKTLNPTKIAGFMRDKAAAATPTINTKSIIEAGERASKLYPQTKKLWDVEKTAFTENMPTGDLLNKLTKMGKHTWTTTGTEKDKAIADLMSDLYAAGRETIKTQAPEVAKYTSELKNVKEFPGIFKGAKTVSWELLKLLGIGAIGKSLSK